MSDSLQYSGDILSNSRCTAQEMVVRGAEEAGDMVAATEYGNEFGVAVRSVPAVQAVQAQAGGAEGRDAVEEACSVPLQLPLPDEAIYFIDSEVAASPVPHTLVRPACHRHVA